MSSRNLLLLLLTCCSLAPHLARPTETSSSELAANELATDKPKESVRLELGHYIAPFNDSLLRLEPEASDFALLGRIRPIPSGSEPHTFAACFSVFTRQSAVFGACTEPTDQINHQLVIQDQAGQHELRSQFYPLDLSKIVAEKTKFDPNKRTIIVLPGYRSSLHVRWMELIREQWLALEDVNVILAYWPDGNSGSYPVAVANTKLFSRQVVIFLYYLVSLSGGNLNNDKFLQNIHLIGHSLGAHVAGFIGQDLHSKVDRITGLDPAGPVFDMQTKECHLDATDAKLVDVIHTNGGNFKVYHAGIGLIRETTNWLFSTENNYNGEDNGYDVSTIGSFLGFERPIGHLDYYANGGSLQPGCNDFFHLCDHKRAYHIYFQLLVHEQRARQVQAAAAAEKQDESLDEPLRFVAFPAINYVDFKTGRSLYRECKQLTSWTRNSSEQDYLSSFDECTVPIYPVGRSWQIWQNLVFRKRVLDATRRLYFLTLANEPYVSDHFLLKIYIDQDSPIEWTPGCKLSVKLSQDDRLFGLTDYTSPTLELQDLGASRGLLLPFSYTSDWRSKSFALQAAREINQILANYSSDESKNEKNLDYLLMTMPSYIDLKISYSAESGKFKRALLKVKDYIKPSNGKELKPVCKIKIRELQVVPIARFEPSFSLWYSSSSDQDESKADYFVHDPNFRGMNESVDLDLAQQNSLLFVFRRISPN